MLPASSLKGGPSDLGHVRHRSSCRSCSASASSGTRQPSSYFEQKDQSAQRHRPDGRHRGRFDVQDRDRSNSYVPCSDDWGRAGRRMRTNWRTTCSHAGPHCQKGGSPYSDFSILTPYSRTMQKQRKTRSLMQQDGTFKALDVPHQVSILGRLAGRFFDPSF